MYYSFSLEAANTNSWVSMQIDEVLFGSDLPYSEARSPENAPYRFTPDTVFLHEDFETQAYLQTVEKGAEFFSQSGSVLSFRFPTGKDDLYQQLQFPTKPINEINYYAARFRFTSPDDDYWSSNATIYFGLENQAEITSPDGFDLRIGVIRREFSFRARTGLYGWLPSFAYDQNARTGDWHTLEMVIASPASNSQPYTVFYWMDGSLMGKSSLEDPAQFLDAKAPMTATIQIWSGSDRHNTLSGEIDELIIGTIARYMAKE
jgi:hypothetical protein